MPVESQPLRTDTSHIEMSIALFFTLNPFILRYTAEAKSLSPAFNVLNMAEAIDAIGVSRIAKNPIYLVLGGFSRRQIKVRVVVLPLRHQSCGTDADLH
ncbi:hypothetical protein ES705_44058 [subsurface metagenome]